MRIYIYIIFLTLFSPFTFIAQNYQTISGKVTDKNSEPIPYANVYIENSLYGGSSDSTGHFSFDFPSADTTAQLIVSMVGYEVYHRTVQMNSDHHVKITLNESSIEINETLVTGSAYTSERGKGVVLDAMDVYTTPGGTADVFQSLKTLPGITKFRRAQKFTSEAVHLTKPLPLLTRRASIIPTRLNLHTADYFQISKRVQ